MRLLIKGPSVLVINKDPVDRIKRESFLYKTFSFEGRKDQDSVTNILGNERDLGCIVRLSLSQRVLCGSRTISYGLLPYERPPTGQ